MGGDTLIKIFLSLLIISFVSAMAVAGNEWLWKIMMGFLYVSGVGLALTMIWLL